MRANLWRGWNTAAYVAVLLANGLANAIPIGGRTTGEVSAMFPVLATPASYAFTIWGAIYALLGVFVLLQWRPGWRELSVFRRIGPWFVVSCAFNIAWLLCWHYLYIRSSVFLILGLLLSLLPIYLATRRVDGSPRDDAGLTSKLFVQLPFSLYTAWIAVASGVNGIVGLKASGGNGWGLEAYWTMLLLLVAAGIAYAAFRRYRDTPFVLTVVWAFVAIGVEQQGAAPIVAWIAWLLAGVLLLLALRIVPARRRRR
ncbi:hypothetical protein FE782_02200 [Paenibacillus antri]|uniref:Tryptophan-rich sensory protein n=1 Tax=Paenibacillus antri TaxID=2582848 RepID=A0A5R9GIN6_9BACL|nr:tryptophan-rich sensory protein [Paenibacillus antri]TLS54180.1 hypothetical protein FE782_02200 [Paenibacillus antri]